MKGLEPVRERRLRLARERAERTLAVARDEAGRRRAAGRAEADALLSAAAREGAASADSDTGREWTAARRQARATILAAQRAAYDDLVAAATAAIKADPRYPRLFGLISNTARRQLGPGTDVRSEGDTMVAARRGREVRWSAGDEVARVLRGGTVDLEELWR